MSTVSTSTSFGRGATAGGEGARVRVAHADGLVDRSREGALTGGRTEFDRPFESTRAPLGLASEPISRRGVDAHGGRIWFESSDQDTTFYIRLPFTGIPSP